jgi:hypothetical protein
MTEISNHYDPFISLVAFSCNAGGVREAPSWKNEELFGVAEISNHYDPYLCSFCPDLFDLYTFGKAFPLVAIPAPHTASPSLSRRCNGTVLKRRPLTIGTHSIVTRVVVPGFTGGIDIFASHKPSATKKPGAVVEVSRAVF